MSTNLSKIIDLINTGSYQKAELILRPLISKDPESFALNKALGVCLMSQYKYIDAINAFKICAANSKNDYDVLVNLSFLYVKIQDYKNSLQLSSDALTLNDQRPEAYNNIAECYFYLNEFTKAEQNILISIEKRGGLNSIKILSFIDTLVLYADILLALNKKDQFLEFCYGILDEGNHIDELLIRILRLDINYIKDKHIENLKKILSNINKIRPLVQKNIAEANAYFFLGEYLEKKDKTKSEDYIIKANKIIASMQRDSLFKRQNKIKSIIDAFNKFNINEVKEKINPKKGEGLIFIIGMPRSGTTLLESIVSTANDCQAGGERLFFTLECNAIIDGPIEKSLDQKFFNSLGDRYLEIIDIQKNGKKFYIDKLPGNYEFYKFINLSLPAAKFIHIYRDPWDNAISLFKQNYITNLFYASSFFGIAMEYANYERLMNFWKKIENNKNIFFDVNYEDLVNQTENVVTKIWEFCGLNGNYDNDKRKEHFSITASKNQIKRDIYKSSVKKSDFLSYKEQFHIDLDNQRHYWENINKIN